MSVNPNQHIKFPIKVEATAVDSSTSAAPSIKRNHTRLRSNSDATSPVKVSELIEKFTQFQEKPKEPSKFSLDLKKIQEIEEEKTDETSKTEEIGVSISPKRRTHNRNIGTFELTQNDPFKTKIQEFSREDRLARLARTRSTLYDHESVQHDQEVDQPLKKDAKHKRDNLSKLRSVTDAHLDSKYKLNIERYKINSNKLTSSPIKLSSSPIKLSSSPKVVDNNITADRSSSGEDEEYVYQESESVTNENTKTVSSDATIVEIKTSNTVFEHPISKEFRIRTMAYGIALPQNVKKHKDKASKDDNKDEIILPRKISNEKILPQNVEKDESSPRLNVTDESLSQEGDDDDDALMLNTEKEDNDFPENITEKNDSLPQNEKRVEYFIRKRKDSWKSTYSVTSILEKLITSDKFIDKVDSTIIEDKKVLICKNYDNPKNEIEFVKKSGIILTPILERLKFLRLKVWKLIIDNKKITPFAEELFTKLDSLIKLEEINDNELGIREGRDLLTYLTLVHSIKKGKVKYWNIIKLGFGNDEKTIHSVLKKLKAISED